ncbi:MAG: 1,4-alpha-glucan branching protein GlgB [Gammaproteobacteria bacterium]|nr:1,4-alpha-glucan branching protein GlgB [Gammaproteobacteria bacterium]
MTTVAAPRLTAEDLYLFGEGNHHQVHYKLGAHPGTFAGREGTNFAVWAPNASRVSVVGHFNDWNGDRNVMESRGNSGVWELFVAGIGAGTAYKFEIRTRDGRLLLKADPYAFAADLRPGNCSLVAELEGYAWGDGAWLEARRGMDPARAPINVYEVHPGSWRHATSRTPPFLRWDELAEQLIPYALDMGYTHLELMGVAEHPLDASWGYQVTGYFAPTARFGPPEAFMAFVDRCHQAGLGVIIDWVPAHFPKDAHGLADFDGSPLYEHADPRQGEHADWGTRIFNYGRHEVRNFLIANALHWIERFHVDGLRVDAVASMLYLDYSRDPGDWVPNRYGGRENLEAIDFLKQLNGVIRSRHPGVLTIAEESTAFPGVTRPETEGGLGFSMKWNMGWMNDTLRYLSFDPIHRRYHHDSVTFSFVYAWSERYMLPLSHDEVVHGKGSLLAKMPGDDWQKRANLRLLAAYMAVHPGKKLLFMGSEWGQWEEWSEAGSLHWHLLGDFRHSSLADFNRVLNRLYRDTAALHATDWNGEAFRWLELHNSPESVFGFLRGPLDGSDRPLACMFNATPVPRPGYRIGLPAGGRWNKIVDSDDTAWGGSGHARHEAWVDAQPGEWNGLPFHADVTLPPLGAVLFRQDG